MTTASYKQLALDWHPESKTDRPFIILVSFFLVLFMGLALLMGSIDLPKQTKREKVVIPERVAKFILDKPKVIKKEPVKPKVVKKPLPKPEEKKPVQVDKKVAVKKQQPKRKAPLTKKQKDDRETASQSGLLALSNELTDLMDTSNIDTMVGTKIAKSSNTKAGDNASSQKRSDVLTANATKGSNGVNSSKVLKSRPKSTVKLDKVQGDGGQDKLLTARADTKIVKSNKPKKASSEKANTARTGNYRPEEDIALVMDQNKGKLHALYRKARRSNPGIEGKIVLEITISPAGKVLKVRIASSELDDKKLEARIMSRVKRFNFGNANVKPVTVTYPIEFLPS